MIQRKVYVEVPPRVEYALIPIGKELIPFIDFLEKWGTKEMDKKSMTKKMECTPEVTL